MRTGVNEILTYWLIPAEPALSYFRADQDEYQLNPHLSLIYKMMSTDTKQEIVSSLSLPFDELPIDSVKAVISPARIESRTDVEAWKVGAAENFIG